MQKQNIEYFIDYFLVMNNWYIYFSKIHVHIKCFQHSDIQCLSRNDFDYRRKRSWKHTCLLQHLSALSSLKENHISCIKFSCKIYCLHLRSNYKILPYIYELSNLFFQYMYLWQMFFSMIFYRIDDFYKLR
jgi:hypothetical protein